MVEIKTLASGSTGNAYFLNDGHTPLLLEAGISWKQIQLGLDFQTSKLAGCLVSHSHQDHCKSVPDAIKAGIDCHMSQATAEGIGVTGHRVKVIEPKKQLQIETWTVLPLPVVHDVETFAFLLANQNGAKALYLTDTMYCPYRFSGLTHILIEINHSLDILRENVTNGTVPVELKNRIIRSHMNLETAKEFFKANDLSEVQEIHLIHMSGENSHAERFKREVQELTGKMVVVAE